MKNKKTSGGNKSEKRMKRGAVPGTVPNQNLGHNSKKTGLGRNTDL